MKDVEKKVIQGYDALTVEEQAELRRLLAKLNIRSRTTRFQGAELLTLTITASVRGVIPQLMDWLHEKALDLIDRRNL